MTPIAKQYLNRIRDAYVCGSDQAIRDLYLELNELNDDHALFLEVWSTLPAATRASIKRILDEK
jgi:hypothetical protein